MKWKEMVINDYPNVILSDCIVNNIQSNNRYIFFDFAESGIIVKSSSDLRYYRTKDAQIKLENCNIDDITIKYIYKKSWKRKMETDIVKEIKWEEFLKKISNEKWQFEIIEEFYSDTGGIFIGKIRKGKKSLWCILKIYFHNIIYFWNEIDFSNSIN